MHLMIKPQPGDVVRLDTRWGVSGQRNRCPLCHRYMASSDTQTDRISCGRCGTVYRQMAVGHFLIEDAA